MSRAGGCPLAPRSEVSGRRPSGLPPAPGPVTRGAVSRHLQAFPRPPLVPFKICNGNKRNPQPSPCENAAGRGRDPAASAGLLQGSCLSASPTPAPWDRCPPGIRFSSRGDSSAPCVLCSAFLAAGAARSSGEQRGAGGGGEGRSLPSRQALQGRKPPPPRLQKPQAPAAAARLCRSRRALRQQRAGRLFLASRRDRGGHRWLRATWLGPQALRWGCGGGGPARQPPTSCAERGDPLLVRGSERAGVHF